MYPSELVLHKIYKSAKCPRCCQPKPQDKMFCEECFEKLPRDIIQDLAGTDHYTQVVAYADATQYLMHEWRE